MKLRADQLANHLKRGLEPIYFIFGDEPLQLNEAADTLRHTTKENGYDERESFHVDSGFDWQVFQNSLQSGSLFADKRLIELRLGSQKPGDAGAKVLRAYAENCADDIVLLITADKLDQASQRSRWFTTLDSAGVCIQIWPVNSAQLPAWIEARLRTKGLQAAPDAISLLAARVEGNLLAAAQEIDKLHLLYGQGQLTLEQMLAAISDSARYTIFDLADAALAGKVKRTVRIINNLRSEGQEPILLLWALAREIRLLSEIRFAVDKGQSVANALQQHKVWEKRKPLINKALQRLTAADCQRLLQHSACLDRIIKGVEPGHAWDKLMLLSLDLSGQPLLMQQTT